MCTVSWQREPEGYALLCNRDERFTRSAAAPPRVFESEGVRYVAPVDGDHGGSWIAANDRGLTLCILNGANLGVLEGTAPGASGPPVSRGLLLPQLIPASEAAEAMDRLAMMDLRRFAPFTLLAIQPFAPAAAAEWDGKRRVTLLNADFLMPLVSSSVESSRVRERRLQTFREASARPEGPGTLDAFHRSHAGGASAYSPCMHREDAETVSFSRVSVGPSQVEFAYHPGAPCREAVCQIQHVARTR